MASAQREKQRRQAKQVKEVLEDQILQVKGEEWLAGLKRRDRLHHRLSELTPSERLEILQGLPDSALLTFAYDWTGCWARDSQLIPEGDWFVWLILAGRGFGKTRTGAESVRYLVEQRLVGRIALIAPTSADARDTMVEGESGILAVSPPWYMPRYEPSKRRLTWPDGQRATLFSAEEPERLRGPQHDLVWGDEPASWTSPAAWSNAVMGLRLGRSPRAIITGTPKPVPLILDLLKDKSTHVTRGSTFENSGNLAPQFLTQITRLYSGTRLGRQEIEAEVLTDMPGALFNQVIIDETRVAEAPQLERVVVSIDPAPTSEAGSDETGITVVGRAGDHAYVLADLSFRGTPDEWARAAIKAFHVHRADAIVAEINVGGDMVEAVLRSVDQNIAFRGVRAKSGKSKRAEPIAALYEQKRVHHVGPAENWERLEKQMRVFTGINGRRDDRCDSMCWGLHDLMIGAGFVFV